MIIISYTNNQKTEEREREKKRFVIRDISSCSAEFRFEKEKSLSGRGEEWRGRWAQVKGERRRAYETRFARIQLSIFGRGDVSSLSLSLRASMNKNEPMLTSAMLDTDSTDRRADFLETDLAATHTINISNTETERRFPFPSPPPSSYLDLAFLQRRQVAPVVIEYQCTRLPREKG